MELAEGEKEEKFSLNEAEISFQKNAIIKRSRLGTRREIN